MASRSPKRAWAAAPARLDGRYHQAGAVLVVGLIFLLILTLLGVTSMRATTLEERMAGNNYDRQIALQSAEMALREAETWLTHNLNPWLHQDCASGLCSNPRYQSVSGWQQDPGHAVWAGARVAVESPPNAAAPPRYVIEDMCESTPPSGIPDSQRVFRITAIGFGGSPEARVVLQTSFVTDNKYGVGGACNCSDPTTYCGSCKMTCSVSP